MQHPEHVALTRRLKHPRLSHWGEEGVLRVRRGSWYVVSWGKVENSVTWMIELNAISIRQVSPLAVSVTRSRRQGSRWRSRVILIRRSQQQAELIIVGLPVPTCITRVGVSVLSAL